MAILTDVSPLRHSRQFRLLYTGQAVSLVGSVVTTVTAPFQLHEITGSTWQVGLLSLVQLPVLFAGSIVGGPLADAYDRRRVLFVVEMVMLAASAGLAWNAVSDHPRAWPIYVLTALVAGLTGIDAPARSACIPAMVGAADLPGALALTQLLHQFGFVVGPALAGLILKLGAPSAAYTFDVATFVVSLGFIARLGPQVPLGGVTKAGLSSLLEGWRYLHGERAVQGTFAIDINAMVFGMPRALFPEMARSTFGGGGGTYGLLSAAPAAGAVVGAVTLGWVTRVERQGRAVFLAVICWGAAIVLFGISPWLWLALLMLALAGWADAISAVFRNTILQLSVPDRFRGRLGAVHIAVVTGGPRLGDVEAAGVAAVSDVRIAAWTGGLACIAGCAVVARAFSELVRWRVSVDGGRHEIAVAGET
ncbi:MAG TPA: MFS transporter [Acidimicrobiales bacterium]|nr:MFS transporter [Acidimicrobiales bacterium]